MRRMLPSHSASRKKDNNSHYQSNSSGSGVSRAGLGMYKSSLKGSWARALTFLLIVALVGILAFSDLRLFRKRAPAPATASTLSTEKPSSETHRDIPARAKPSDILLVSTKHTQRPFHFDIVLGSGSTREKIPKIIWTYWHEEKLPPFVEDCIQGWKLRAPDHQVIAVNNANLRQHVSTRLPNYLFDMPVTAWTADWIRQALLKEHGGIWMDSTMVLMTNLSFVHTLQESYGTEMFLFHLDASTQQAGIAFPHFENFMMGSVKQSPFQTAWFEEVDKIVHEHAGSDTYFDALISTYGQDQFNRLLVGIAAPSYLKSYVAIRKINMFDGRIPSVYAQTAETNAYALEFRKGGLSHIDEMSEEMLKDHPEMGYFGEVIKFASYHRNNFLDHLGKVSDLSTIGEESIFKRFIHKGGTVITK